MRCSICNQPCNFNESKCRMCTGAVLKYQNILQTNAPEGTTTMTNDTVEDASASHVASPNTLPAEVMLEVPRELLREVREAMVKAAVDIAGWGEYASPYFQEKWGLEADVQHQRDTLAKLNALLGEG